MESEHQALLIEEYKGCDEKISRLDSLIWQTASVIFPISLAGFALFGLSTNHTGSQFFIVLAVAIGSMALLITWFLLSRAWYGYQSIAFYRMREIETELGLWHYRYARFMRQSEQVRKKAIQNEKDDDVKARLQKLEAHISPVSRVGLRVTMAIVTAIFLIGWIGVLIREYILAF